MSSLFRTESQSERERAWLGRIVLIRPLSFAALSWCAAIIAAGIIALFVFGEYTRKARLAGVLAPTAGTARTASGSVHPTGPSSQGVAIRVSPAAAAWSR